MRAIRFLLINAKDAKTVNIVNRVRAYCHAYGIHVEVSQNPNRSAARSIKLDFDMVGLSASDIQKYSSICSQISAIVHFSDVLWDLTTKENRPEDWETEIQKTKKRVQFEKEKQDQNFFQLLLSHYDQVWYLREILGKDSYDEEDRINWSLHPQELAALKRLIGKIKDKVLISKIEWNKENAINSFDAFLTASVTYPITKDYKKHFSLHHLDLSFIKVYRHVRQSISSESVNNGSKEQNLEEMFDSFFTR